MHSDFSHVGELRLDLMTHIFLKISNVLQTVKLPTSSDLSLFHF